MSQNLKDGIAAGTSRLALSMQLIDLSEVSGESVGGAPEALQLLLMGYAFKVECFQVADQQEG